ncbi:MAG TPA: VWA domain-containing protein, partial [Trebonia sp.]|nr:VWA domain-containing protein [Trebonia sp.]
MDDMRLALVLNAVSPAIGGVLVRGEKGSAKSTAVRALTAVLPPVDVLPGCRFSCSPEAPDPQCPDGPHPVGGTGGQRPARLVELPVGATEDRLTGSLDIGRALTEGVSDFQPGLLAAAHRGVLYVDEVNLLHDHLVDLLLDAAALGTSYVERDGVSVRHQARFLLVGTMNPEEGELRPQLLDRFGLTVEAAAPRDPAARAEIVRRRLAFDTDPDAFAAKYAAGEADLAAAIAAARDRLPSVVLDDPALLRIAAVCAAFDVDGLRADIVIARAATAHAAWRGAAAVDREDIRAAARLALPHRRRRNPFDAPGLDEQQLEDALGDPGDDAPEPPDDNGGGQGPGDAQPDGPGDGAPGGSQADGPGSEGGSGAGDDSPPEASSGQAPSGQTPSEQAPSGQAPSEQAPSGKAAPESVATAGDTFRARRLEVPGKGQGAAGRRSRAATDAGRSVGARPPQPASPTRDVHLTATLTASAPHQRRRGRTGPGLLLARADLREHRREGRESNLVLFLVDASGSMAARRRMEAVKGAVLSLLLDAYQRRDKVGLVSFRAAGAELLLPPTSSVDAAARRLRTMPAGGRTPLAAGLAEAHAVLRREQLRHPRRRPLLVVVTDGRHTAGGDPAAAAAALLRDGIAAVVVDCESGPVRLGLAAGLAAELGAEYLNLSRLSAAGAAGPAASQASQAGQPAGRSCPQAAWPIPSAPTGRWP